MALIKYFLTCIFVWCALFLGFGKIPPSEVKSRHKFARDINYKPTKRKRKNSDQWGKRYFKQK